MSPNVINISPNIMSGSPVFSGTRVLIKTLFDYLECGDSIENFLIDFPSVKREQVIQLLELAEHSILPSETLHEHTHR